MGALLSPIRLHLGLQGLVPDLTASRSLIPSQFFSTIIFCTIRLICAIEIPRATTIGYT